MHRFIYSDMRKMGHLPSEMAFNMELRWQLPTGVCNVTMPSDPHMYTNRLKLRMHLLWCLVSGMLWIVFFPNCSLCAIIEFRIPSLCYSTTRQLISP